MSPPFCCGHVITSRGSSLPILSDVTTYVSACISSLCPSTYRYLILPIHSSVHPLIAYLLVLLPQWNRELICLVHSYVFST